VDDSRPDPIERVESLLSRIYGDEGASAVYRGFRDLIAEHVGHTRTRGRDGPRTSSWLIAYPDHLSDGDEAPLATLGDFMRTYLTEVLTGIHVLPCFPSSSDEGFSVMDYTAIDPAYGTWSDLDHLAESGDLMLDAVINHASAKGHWFTAWRGGDTSRRNFFRTEDPTIDLSDTVRARHHPLLTRFETTEGPEWVWTTFSEDQADLDYRNPLVTLAVADVLMTYASHGASAIRLDAVGFLWKQPGTPSIHLRETHLIIQLLRACLDAAYPDVLLVSETNVPHEENISYLGDGSVHEADMVYQFPLPPLTLHAFSTGDATRLSEWLATTNGIPAHTTYFNFLASHDGIGLRPLEGLVPPEDVASLVKACKVNGGLVNYREDTTGERVPYELNGTWYDLIRGDHGNADAIQRHIASHGLMFALKGQPAVYLQALLAESNATDLAMGTGSPRSINRKRFTLSEIAETLANPASRGSTSLEALSTMLRWRASTDAFDPDSTQTILTTPPGIIGIGREAASGAVARVYVNVGSSDVEVEESRSSSARGFRIRQAKDRLTLGPWGIAWVLPPDGPPSI
jgi:sucrose phosphorylase